MTKEELQQFKGLFRKYCHEEICKGHCNDDSCELCPVNSAYDEIFHRFANDQEDEDSDE